MHRLVRTGQYVKHFLWAGGKAVMAALSGSALMLISAACTLGIGFARRAAVRESGRGGYRQYRFVGAVIVLSSLVYEINSAYRYCFGVENRYDLYTALGIATFSLIDLGLVIGVAGGIFPPGLKTRQSDGGVYLHIVDAACSAVFNDGRTGRFPTRGTGREGVRRAGGAGGAYTIWLREKTGQSYRE